MDLKDPTYQALHRYTKALSVALGFRDSYTRVHSERVVALCEAMGVRMQLSRHELGILKISAAFHDIGKIGVPDHILLKPGRLDEPEVTAMQLHPGVGAEIITATELEGAARAALAIRHHHERWDGTGYPDGLAGEAIPLCSRIISIADSYDAMSMTRAYHPSRPHSEIMKVLNDEAAAKHDPKLIDIFRSLIEGSPFRAPER